MSKPKLSIRKADWNSLSEDDKVKRLVQFNEAILEWERKNQPYDIDTLNALAIMYQVPIPKVVNDEEDYTGYDMPTPSDKIIDIWQAIQKVQELGTMQTTELKVRDEELSYIG